jgi:hypothetical protein
MYLPMASNAVAAGTLHMDHTVHINEVEVVDQFASDVQRLCSNARATKASANALPL